MSWSIYQVPHLMEMPPGINCMDAWRETRKAKKYFWYWMAAACLLGGLMVALLNQRKTISQPEHHETAIKQPKKTDILVVRTNKYENRIESIQDKIIRRSDKPVQRNRRILLTQVSAKVQSNESIIDDPEQHLIAKPLQIVRNSTAAVVLPKKKLNVVHINELGDPVVESSDVTRIEDIHSFKLRFGNGEVFSNPPVVSKPPGIIILKTKTASN